MVQEAEQYADDDNHHDQSNEIGNGGVVLFDKKIISYRRLILL